MMDSIVILGAGAAGLAAGRFLNAEGINVTLLDKGRGVGGRVSTRRSGSENGRWDHGAQFVTLRNDRLRSLLADWGALDILEHWHAAKDGLPRQRPPEGMNAFAKALSTGLTVHSSRKITRLSRGSDHWELHCECGSVYTAGAVICTLPAPQLLELLQASGLDSGAAEPLRQIEYDRNLTLMASLDGPSGLEAPGYLRPDSAILHTVVDNQLKGISAVPTVTAQSTPPFAREWYDRDRATAASVLRAALQELLSARITSVQIHGWKFAEAIRRHPEPCLEICEGLWAAGDGFTSDAHHPRIESALLSGLAAAERIMHAH